MMTVEIIALALLFALFVLAVVFMIRDEDRGMDG